MLEKQLEKLYDYQITLTTRRWQYLVVYLTINGLLFSSGAKDTMAVLSTGETIPTLATQLFPVVAVILGIIFSQLVVTATERIEKTEKLITAARTITQLRLEGQFLGRSETLLTYAVIYVILAVWIAYSAYFNTWAGIFLGLLALVNTFSLKWRAGLHT